MKNLIGIIGGMGPAATVDMFNKFIKLSNAKKDQDHIPLVITSIPQIPDRTQALLNDGESPLNYMIEHLKILENAGAKLIIIACNTAHYWFPELKTASKVEMFSIVESTIQATIERKMIKVGLLATDATIATGLYQKTLKQHNIDCIKPNQNGQKEVMRGIYLLKSGDLTSAEELLRHQVKYLLEQDVQGIILGCTEIPVILAKEISKFPNLYVDSTESLVRSSIKWYYEHT